MSKPFNHKEEYLKFKKEKEHRLLEIIHNGIRNDEHSEYYGFEFSDFEKHDIMSMCVSDGYYSKFKVTVELDDTPED